MKRLKQAAQGTATASSFMSCSTLASSLTGSAAARSRLAECTAVLPQHSQPGISWRVTPSAPAVALKLESSSVAVPCSEHPG